MRSMYFVLWGCGYEVITSCCGCVMRSIYFVLWGRRNDAGRPPAGQRLLAVSRTAGARRPAHGEGEIKFSHSRQANAFRHFSKGGGVKGQRLRAPAVRETASRGWRRGRRLARRKPQPEPGTTRGIAPVVLRRGRNFPLQRAQEGAGSCASCGSLPQSGKRPQAERSSPSDELPEDG